MCFLRLEMLSDNRTRKVRILSFARPRWKENRRFWISGEISGSTNSIAERQRPVCISRRLTAANYSLSCVRYLGPGFDLRRLLERSFITNASSNELNSLFLHAASLNERFTPSESMGGELRRFKGKSGTMSTSQASSANNAPFRSKKKVEG